MTCPIFDSSPIHQFSILKIQLFALGMLILGKDLSNFVSPDLKLHNRNCHTGRVRKQNLSLALKTAHNNARALSPGIFSFAHVLTYLI